jgi:hypothetical protein
MELSIDEVVTGIDQLKTKEERVATLRKYKHPAIEAVLRGAYDPDIKWALPEGPVPYRASGAIDQQGMLYSEYKRFYVFIEGSCPNLSQRRRELLFVQFLESLHPGDGALMTMVKDKQLPYSNITPELVDEAYPGLLGNWKKEIRPVPPAPWIKEVSQELKELDPYSDIEMVSYRIDGGLVTKEEYERRISAPPKEKKPTSPKKLAAMEKARATRRANLAAKKAVEGK